MGVTRARRRFAFLRIPALIVLTLATTAAFAATITVNTTSDDLAPNDGSVSLREAITAINAGNDLGDPNITAQNPGTFGVNDAIHFNIAGAAVHTITPASNLPQIVKAVLIDGYSQPGASVNTLAVGDNAKLLIQIDGTNTSTALGIQGPNGGSTIRGLLINNFSVAIAVGRFGGFESSNNIVTGNFIGTDPTGTTNAAPAVNQDPLSVYGSGNTIGGPDPSARNILTGTGVMIGVHGDNNTVQGNYIGVNAAGTGALPAATGIFLGEFNGPGTGNQIGGAVSGAGNVIGNFTTAGIIHHGISNNRVEGNLIGTNATGTAGLTAGLNGIVIGATGVNNVIGGTLAGAGNLISGAGNNGILIGATGQNPETGTLIQGNRIGTDITGTLPMGNGLAGICIEATSSSGMIGGTVAGAGNRIAFNGSHAVAIGSNATNWGILGNSIEANTGLGIALDAGCDSAGVPPLPNDPGDADTGSNNLQNYPVLTGLAISAGLATVSGTLNSAVATAFRVEFFSNTACDASGFGQGKTFIGFANVTTNGSGNASFAPPPFAVQSGQSVITATATDPLNNTSEFSQCIKPPVTLDVDGNSQYEALTDGLLTIRYLFGLSGTSLTAGAIGTGATRATPADITLYLDNIRPSLDVDDNGQEDALTDGLMIIRYLFGLRGAPLISGAIGSAANRTTASAIETYIQSLMP